MIKGREKLMGILNIILKQRILTVHGFHLKFPTGTETTTMPLRIAIMQ